MLDFVGFNLVLLLVVGYFIVFFYKVVCSWCILWQ
jgi:hypothetical protein